MKPFYVYRLIDPRGGLPFYVGKGSGNRSEHSCDPSRCDSNPRKKARIINILSSGHKVVVEIVARFKKEGDALKREMEVIAEFRGHLTNQSEGGEGATLSKAERELRAHRSVVSRVERFASSLPPRLAGEVISWVSEKRANSKPVELPPRGRQPPKVRKWQWVKPGVAVSITGGPFALATGSIVEVDAGRMTAKVGVAFLGRVTPTEVGFDQIEDMSQFVPSSNLTTLRDGPVPAPAGPSSQSPDPPYCASSGPLARGYT